MANTRSGTVIRVDTDAAFTENVSIKSILYEAGSSGAVEIKADSASGSLVFAWTSDTDAYFPNLDLELKSGFHVNVTGTGTIVYLYLR